MSVLNRRYGRLSRLAKLFDSLFKRQVERFVSTRPVFSAVPRECNQCSREAFAVVEAAGPVAVGGEYEEVLTVKDSVEPEFAEPSQFLVGGSYEHLGLESHAVTRQMHDELLAYLGSPLDPHGRIPLAVAREIDQDIPYRLFRCVDVNVRVDHDARH